MRVHVAIAFVLTVCTAVGRAQVPVTPEHATTPAYNVALGVECSPCHVEGDWTAGSKRPHQMVARMAPIFDLIPTYFDAAVRMPRTQCYMCHQGRTRIERLPAAAPVVAQAPVLAQVLDRAGSYVADFERQLTGIAAAESYTQSMGIPGRNGEFIATTERDLKATLVLVREGEEGYLEARDVSDVDGVPVRDRAGTLAARAASEARGWSTADKMRLRSENARYNIGDIVRTINTPLLALQVLRRPNQHRFVFSITADRASNVRAPSGDTPGVFRTSTDIWTIQFRERAPGTLIRTEKGRDVPCRGRLWIDPESGRVMMTEMIVDSGRVQAEVTVSFQSEPLLGLLPPIEMHEHYRASGKSQTIVEASATYGPFHLIGPAPQP